MTKPIKTTTTKLKTIGKKPLSWRDLPVNKAKPEPLPEWLDKDNVDKLRANSAQEGGAGKGKYVESDPRFDGWDLHDFPYGTVFHGDGTLDLPPEADVLARYERAGTVMGLSDAEIGKLADAIATEVTGHVPKKPMEPYDIVHPGEVLRHVHNGKAIIEEQPGTVVLTATPIVTNKGNPLLDLNVHGFLRYGDVELLANWLHDWLGHHADMHTNPKGEE